MYYQWIIAAVVFFFLNNWLAEKTTHKLEAKY